MRLLSLSPCFSPVSVRSFLCQLILHSLFHIRHQKPELQKLPFSLNFLFPVKSRLMSLIRYCRGVRPFNLISDCLETSLGPYTNTTTMITFILKPAMQSIQFFTYSNTEILVLRGESLSTLGTLIDLRMSKLHWLNELLWLCSFINHFILTETWVMLSWKLKW